MMLFLRILLCLCLLVLPAAAQEPKALKGVALVIGESEYRHIAPLANPGTDADAIEKLLSDLGFDVTGVTDRDARKLSRDFERFVEDAEGADVALIYYSGHGIEAGGENWLVPVDADPAAIADGGQGLVALTPVLDQLKATVPVTIFLIDACRSNPFPPGALIRKDGKELEMSTGGLGAPRGFSQVTADNNESLGTVIGFAAEPGRPALDGEKGGNSPYAAAILRHLSAMPGQEFGLVMRMVTEEVYLKTRTQQRPWVNESLRTQLFFGTPEPRDDSPDGIITGERRKLLLTIAGLPDPERKQVEQIAKTEDVPLDTLYGVLAALGATDIPKDPEALGKALQAQADRLKDVIAEQKALAVDDPALKALTDAADKALGDGALKAARGFLDQAKALVEKSRTAIEDVEAQARAKRIANAAVLVKSAEAAELDFDPAAAIKDYAAAADWVKDADPALAAKYTIYEADAWQTLGEQKGDPKTFDTAIALYEKTLGLLDPGRDRELWGKASNNLANTWLHIGERGVDAAPLEKAVALYRQSLDALSDKEDSFRATTLSNLGIALHTLGKRKNDDALLQEARQSFEASLALIDKQKDPYGYASGLLNAANLDVDMADRDTDPAQLAAAKAKIDEALALLDPVVNRHQVMQAKNNLAIVLRLQGAAARDPELVKQSIAVYQEVIAGTDRATFPFDWGSANGNLAIAMTNLGALTGDIPMIASALPFFEKAFEEVTKERAPAMWANTQSSYGLALQVVGFMNKDNAIAERAVDAFRAALSVKTREKNPLDWASVQSLLASSLSSLATAKADPKLGDEAIAAYRAALEVYTPEVTPKEWRSAAAGLATALQGKGILVPGDAELKEAKALLEKVLAATSRAETPLDWASAMKDVATIKFMLGTKNMDKKLVEESIADFDKALDEYNKSGGFMDRMMINAMKNNAVEALKLFN